METVLTLINIYGPNRDNPAFYSQIKQKIEDQNLANIIWGGDWNLVLNANLDYHNYRNINNPKAQGKVLEVMNVIELVDIWREISTRRIYNT